MGMYVSLPIDQEEKFVWLMVFCRPIHRVLLYCCVVYIKTSRIGKKLQETCFMGFLNYKYIYTYSYFVKGQNTHHVYCTQVVPQTRHTGISRDLLQLAQPHSPRNHGNQAGYIKSERCVNLPLRVSSAHQWHTMNTFARTIATPHLSDVE